MEELRCLVCQGQSIADSDAELAGDMRDLVRARIAAGEKPGGDPPLADRALWQLDQLRPTAEPAAWPLWLAPSCSVAAAPSLVRKRIGSGADGLGDPARFAGGCSLGALWLLGLRGGRC